MTDERFSCSDAAELRDEPLYGTASQVCNWLLIEQPGAWGRDALLESKLPADVGLALRRAAKPLRIRVVLIRRGARMVSERRNVFFARTHPDGSWISHRFVDDPQELLELDLEPLALGKRIERSVPVDHPVFLVCTHGRHDACCSVRGNQVSRLACSAYPSFSWECSHIGGDRFAANIVCFPNGVYYGRVGAAELIDLVESFGSGWISLKHYRGRSCYPFDVQAAEYFLRREQNLLGLEEVGLEGYERKNGVVRTTFVTSGGGRAEVTVRRSLSAGRYRLTCNAEKEDPIPLYELVSATSA